MEPHYSLGRYTKNRDYYKITGADQLQAYPSDSGVPSAPAKTFTAVGPWSGADIIIIDGDFENAGVAQYAISGKSSDAKIALMNM